MAKVSDRAVLVYQIERRSRSDCVHEQVAKRIANVRFTYIKDVRVKRYFAHTFVQAQVGE